MNPAQSLAEFLSKSILESCCDPPSPSPGLLLNQVRGWGGRSVVHVAHVSHCGGQAAGQAFADLPVILRFGLQECHDVLKGAGWLQAQGIHHVDQVVCRDREQTDTAQQTEHQARQRKRDMHPEPPKCRVSVLPQAARALL